MFLDCLLQYGVEAIHIMNTMRLVPFSRYSLGSHPEHHQTSCQISLFLIFGNKKTEVQRNVVDFLKVEWQVIGEIRNRK